MTFRLVLSDEAINTMLSIVGQMHEIKSAFHEKITLINEQEHKLLEVNERISATESHNVIETS